MDGPSEHDRRGSVVVLLFVLYVGVVSLVLVDVLFDLGPVAGSIGFTILPLAAALAAQRHLKSHEPDDL